MDMEKKGDIHMINEREPNRIYQRKLPRIMIAAPNSGSGKTTIVCGLLQAWVNRGLVTNAYKCGPDYIDPMFHRTVLQVPTGNLDTFFSDETMLRYLFEEAYHEQANRDSIAVVEGVMGYYDGKSLDSLEGSSYDLGRKLELPVILVVNGKGASLSILAQIKGFLTFQEPSMIKGILLNQVSSSIYQGIKQRIENELKIPVVGYLSPQKKWGLASRHLGLVKPDEIQDLREKVLELARQMEETVDLERILQIANQAPKFSYEIPEKIIAYEIFFKGNDKIRVAIAQDEAFCFYYKENRTLMEKAGVELIPFSPIKDRELPHDIQGLILGGGYPELYVHKLAENHSMKESICGMLEAGLPCLAECGGFLYLQETLADEEGKQYPMVGFLKGNGRKAEKRSHFGYISVQIEEKSVLGEKDICIPGHEFHYWESDQEGNAGRAVKPDGIRTWKCIQVKRNTLAGFPHFYFPGNLKALQSFITCCGRYKQI